MKKPSPIKKKRKKRNKSHGLKALGLDIVLEFYSEENFIEHHLTINNCSEDFEGMKKLIAFVQEGVLHHDYVMLRVGPEVFKKNKSSFAHILKVLRKKIINKDLRLQVGDIELSNSSKTKKSSYFSWCWKCKIEMTRRKIKRSDFFMRMNDFLDEWCENCIKNMVKKQMMMDDFRKNLSWEEYSGKHGENYENYRNYYLINNKLI